MVVFLRAEDLASESLLQERMTLKELVDLHSDPPLDGLPQMNPCMYEPISSERGESSNSISLGGYIVARTLSFLGFFMGGGAPNRTHTHTHTHTHTPEML